MQRLSSLSCLALGCLISVALGCARSSAGGAPPQTRGAQGQPAPPASLSARQFADGPQVGLQVDDTREAAAYLFVTKVRFEELRQEAAQGSPQWKALERNVAQTHRNVGSRRSGAGNIAFVYLLTGDKQYAKSAYAWAKHGMDTDKVERDRYLYYGDAMRPVAQVLNYCADALSAEQKASLANYLAEWTTRMWQDRRIQWALNTPVHNYHMAYLEGTALAGYALRAAGDSRGDAFIRKLHKQLKKPGGVLDYLRTEGAGGDWPEGANYGQRSKQRLFATLALIAAAGGKNHIASERYFAESIYYAVYQLQPDRRSLHPAGDLARHSLLPATPLDRDYVQIATYWLADKAARQLGQWYLRRVVPSYDTGSPALRHLLYQDLIYSVKDPTRKPESLKLFYLAKGSQWLGIRSGWHQNATALTISGLPRTEMGHAHFETGSFTLFKGGWQAIDSATFSRSGLLWQPGAHNGVNVDHAERRFGRKLEKGRGILQLSDTDEYSYAQVDGAPALRRKAPRGQSSLLLSEYIREFVFLKPDTLVLYDRVKAADPATPFDWRLHTATRPALRNKLFQSRHEKGGLSLSVLAGDSPQVETNDDLKSRSWRISTTSPSGRFLNVIRVGLGPAPKLQARNVSAGETMQGARLENDVVLFSTAPLGASPTTAFQYSLPKQSKRVHTWVNMPTKVAVTHTISGSEIRITVTPGGPLKANTQGVVRWLEP